MLCSKMTSARSGYVWNEPGDFTSMMSFATAHTDAYFGLDNDHSPTQHIPEKRSTKRYGISHHMCIRDWDQNIRESNNQNINAHKDVALKAPEDPTNYIINCHEKICLTTSDQLMSENSDEYEETVEKNLPSFHEHSHSNILDSMANVGFSDAPCQPAPRLQKTTAKKGFGTKPPIAPKPMVFRTQSDAKFIQPDLRYRMRPRSDTVESEPYMVDKSILQNEDKLNKNVIRGYKRSKPIVRQVRPPVPTPRKSVAIIKTSPSIHLKQVESSNSINTANTRTGTETAEQVVVSEVTSNQRRYGVIDANNHNESAEPITTPTSSKSQGRDSGSRYSVNLEQIISASPRRSENNEDSHGLGDSCRLSLNLDNAQARGEASSDECDPQKVSNISGSNNELNDSFKEDLPTAQVHNMQGRMKDKRALRQSVMALHVPVRERAAQFERIVAHIRASTDLSSSKESSRSSSQSHSPPDSPRDFRSMSYGWENEVSLRLRLNRSRDSSQQSTSTSSRSGSSRTNHPVSRSMSASSIFSDYRLSYSSTDELPHDSYAVHDNSKPEQMYESTELSDISEAPMLPVRCPIKRDVLKSARIINHNTQEAFYENMNEPVWSNSHSQDHIYNEPPTDEKLGVKENYDPTYEVYLNEDDLCQEFSKEQKKKQETMEGNHSDGYHGDIDKTMVEELKEELTPMSSDEIGEFGLGHKPLKPKQSISRTRRRQAIRKNIVSSKNRLDEDGTSIEQNVTQDDFESMTANSQDIAMKLDSKVDGYNDPENLYDEIGTPHKEIPEASPEGQENSVHLCGGDDKSTDNEIFTESRFCEKLPWRKTMPHRTCEAKDSSSFKHFQALPLGSNKNKDNAEADAAVTARTKQRPDLIQDANNKDLQGSAYCVGSDDRAYKEDVNYVNVGDKMRAEEAATDYINLNNETSDALYDDVSLTNSDMREVKTTTSFTMSEGKQQNRHMLGISQASESSTASYIDIEEEILTKQNAENILVAHHSSSSDIQEDAVIIQPIEDDYDILARARTPVNIETAVSDDDALLEKSSSSSKDSEDDSDTASIYANIMDEPCTAKFKETKFKDDIYFPEINLIRDDRPVASDSYDTQQIYQRPDSVISENSYLSLLEDFQTMDCDRASYYISDDNLSGTMQDIGQEGASSSNIPAPQSTTIGNSTPDVIMGTDPNVNADEYQDVNLLISDIPCEPLPLPVPSEEYRSISSIQALKRETRRRCRPEDKPPLPPRIEVPRSAELGRGLEPDEAIQRQQSRFVNKEPLFQIYQATVRNKDPYAAPKSLVPRQPPQSQSPRRPRNLPSPSYPPPPPPTSVPPSLRRGPSGSILPVESVYSEPQVHESVITEENEENSGSTISNSNGGQKNGDTVSIASSVLHRSYWCELREVVKSGVLGEMSDQEKKLQEAMFEVITSEASYLRSLNLVIKHFMASSLLRSQMQSTDHHVLFSNIKSVRDASEKLLLELEKRQDESIVIVNVCDILLKHLQSDSFNCYAVYCANNQYQLRILDKLRKTPMFTNALQTLESDPVCQHLDIQSFLMLPFQRITRLPLLVSAIQEHIQRLRPDSADVHIASTTFNAARKMAKKCDEEATKMERIEEVTLLASQMEYREGVKKMDISQHTTIVKRGLLSMVTMDNRAKRKIIKKKLIVKDVYILVFMDKVVIAKEKIKRSEREREQRSYKEIREMQRRFEVIDWCQRNLIQVQVITDQTKNKLPEGMPPSCSHVFVLTFIQNQQKKPMTFILSASSESERQRWVDAISSTSEGEAGEKIYESWDCPQVMCIAPYDAKERDELTLQVNDRMDILTKNVDGLYKGQRVSDYATGWFPASCVEEIVNEHVRARHLKQRHQILNQVDERIKLQKIGR